MTRTTVDKEEVLNMFLDVEGDIYISRVLSLVSPLPLESYVSSIVDTMIAKIGLLKIHQLVDFSFLALPYLVSEATSGRDDQPQIRLRQYGKQNCCQWPLAAETRDLVVNVVRRSWSTDRWRP